MSIDRSYSSVDEDNITDAARKIQQFAQDLLKGLRFRGTFVEKRYVPVIKMYRSVIHINADEKPLMRILKEVTNRINKLLGANNPFFWIGFTKSNDQYFLWVNLTQEILGEFIFNIRGFEINPIEAKVRVRQVSGTKETSPQPETTFNDIGSNFMDETVKPIFKSFVYDLGINLRSTLTFTNLKDASFFVIITLFAITSGAFYSAKYLLEFFLRLTREFSFIMKTLTPTILSLIDLFKYIIFGFFWVILALFKPSHNVPNNQGLDNQLRSVKYNAYNSDQYQYQTGRRAITYRYPNIKRSRYQGAKIIELQD